MKKLLLIMISALVAACGNQVQERKPSSGDTAMLQKAVAQALNSAVKECSARGGNVLIMDVATGEMVVDYSVEMQGDSLVVLPVGHEMAMEPGALLAPMIPASIIEDPSMNLDTGMMVKVGRQYFLGPYCVMDAPNVGDVDSLPLNEAFARHSDVAMCELAEMYYSNCHDSLRARLFRIFPKGRVENLKIGHPKSLRDVGIMMVDGKRRQEHNQARRFFQLCCGYGLEVYPRDVLSYYNSVAGGRTPSAEILRGFLVEEVEADTNAGAYTIGRIASVADMSHPSRCTAACIGFFPAEKPQYSCMVVLYESSEPGRKAAGVFRDIVCHF